MNTNNYLLTACLLVSSVAIAQERSSSSINLKIFKKSDITMPVDIKAEGKRFSPTWGLDLAWPNEQNLRKGLRHMGAENVGIGRTSFRVFSPLVNDVSLAIDQIGGLSMRSTMFDIVSKDLPLVMNCDNGYRPENSTEPFINTYYTKANKTVNVDHWAKCIEAHVAWMKENSTHPIIGVSPFNEPDNAWEKNLRVEIQGNKTDEANVARKLKTYDSMQGILMCGGNTLNDDNAINWYNEGSDVYDWGNTHQLAGSMDSYVNFYDRLQNDGKVGYNDEMHNVVEAMAGLEHGMSVGIWWGFDSRVRGEFCDISRHGERLDYRDHRNNWTAASIYRHDDGRVKAFIGSSERQANTTSYQFVSPQRDLYFDGQGPLRAFRMEIPGGTGYMNGQVNAERVIDITWGDDVQPSAIDGQYQIVNEATGLSIGTQGDNIVVQKYEKLGTQKWNVTPAVSPTTSGDFSFYDITASKNDWLHLNVQDFSTFDGANVMAYGANKVAHSNEQWYLEYAGNGTYYIRNRENALYLTTVKTSAINNVNVQTNELLTGEDRTRQLWRFLPVTATFDRKAPAQPQGLVADAQPASVRLSWDANKERDLDGYMILRAEKGREEWNTIARKVKKAHFVDNTCLPSVDYVYKVKAIDLSENLSEASETIESTATGEKAMIARWHFETNLYDETPNMMDAVHSDTPAYVDDTTNDIKYLSLTNGAHLQLPYNIANHDEMTIAMWIKMRANNAWQRVFDFGLDDSHYMFLTTNNGKSGMRFAIKNGGDEQILDATQNLALSSWKYLTVTIGKDKTAIYLNGEEVGSSNSITIKPSDLHAVLNYVGRSQFLTDPNMPMLIRDMRIYNYAADVEEIKVMMNDKSNDIKDVKDEKQPSAIYGIDGTRRSQMKRGINIIDKKKVMKK